MKTRIVLLVLVVLATSAPLAWADDERLADAAQVVVRRSPDLATALRAAIGPIPKATSSLDRLPPIAVIVDVTPYTAAAAPDIARAFAELDRTFGTRAKWHLARLGEKTWTPVPLPSLLGPLVKVAVTTDTDEVATIPALRRTLATFPAAKGAVVLYLADWHFEDDVELEAFVTQLERRGQRFSVIGSEACFGRAWTDGFYPPDRLSKDPLGATKLYADDVGRSPFGPEDVNRPWHGGDTAWPHVPFHIRGHWATEFPVELAPPPARTVERGHRDDGELPEDLRERQKESSPPEALERYWFPLPSGFGSYPLMRAAAVTGGRYVLWSWNPSGRTDVTYDYSRVNLFSPDLRPRKEVHADVRKRPLARAIVKAWHAAGNDKHQAADVTPPLDEDARAPLEMQEARGWFPSGGWGDERSWREFLAKTPAYLRSVDQAIDILTTATKTPAKDAIDRRYEADALLFLHTLLVLRFQAGEMFLEAKTLDPKTAWDDLPLHPTLLTEIHIRQGHDPEAVAATGVRVNDEKRGAALVETRRRFLERFQGTPFGELVARNRVNTYRIGFVGYASGNPGKTSPAESAGKAPVTPPPSGGGGPATGR